MTELIVYLIQKGGITPFFRTGVLCEQLSCGLLGEEREQSQLKGLAQESKPFPLVKQTYLRAMITVTGMDAIPSLCGTHGTQPDSNSTNGGGGGGGYSVCITDEETGAQKAIVELSQTWKLGSLTPDPYWRKTWCYHWVPLQGLAVLSTAGREPTGLPLGRELQPQAPH